MKKFLVLAFSFALALSALAGCSSGKLPEGFVKEDVVKEAEDAVKLLSDGDYDSMEKRFSSDMKTALDADALEKALSPQLEKLGAFDSVTSTAVTGGKNDQVGDYAVAVLVCRYENGSATYTVSIDADGFICGLYMK